MRRLFSDLRKHRNLDVYATILAAVVVSVLSLADVLSPEKLPAVTLAVLAILAFTSLSTRDIVTAGSTESDIRAYEDFPSDLVRRRDASKDILLIGVSLSRTIETSFGAFESNLRNGARIRILLTHPEASEAAIDARCQMTSPPAEELRNEIRSSLRKIARLPSRGRLQVKATRTALKFGMNYLDINTAHSTICVQLYSFRLDHESKPILLLSPKDGKWFEFYRLQAERLWKDATTVDLVPFR